MTPVERIYNIDGGIAEVADASIYSPGIDVGRHLSLSCNAYLIRRAGQWILWDTGIDDELVKVPGGEIIAHGIRGVVKRTIISQFREIGVDPDDISLLILSHAHFDHVGNTRLFPRVKWIVQRREYDAMFGPDFAEHGFSLSSTTRFAAIRPRSSKATMMCLAMGPSASFRRRGIRRAILHSRSVCPDQARSY